MFLASHAYQIPHFLQEKNIKECPQAKNSEECPQEKNSKECPWKNSKECPQENSKECPQEKNSKECPQEKIARSAQYVVNTFLTSFQHTSHSANTNKLTLEVYSIIHNTATVPVCQMEGYGEKVKKTCKAAT